VFDFCLDRRALTNAFHLEAVRRCKYAGVGTEFFILPLSVCSRQELRPSMLECRGKVEFLFLSLLYIHVVGLKKFVNSFAVCELPDTLPVN
jgi:hypothetical protein